MDRRFGGQGDRRACAAQHGYNDGGLAHETFDHGEKGVGVGQGPAGDKTIAGWGDRYGLVFNALIEHLHCGEAQGANDMLQEDNAFFPGFH